MELCNKDQAQEYRDEFGQLAAGDRAAVHTVPSPQAHKTLAELGLNSIGGDEHVFGCGD